MSISVTTKKKKAKTEQKPVMMKIVVPSPRVEHFVTFRSPGTLFAEETTQKLAGWDLKKAAKKATKIVERYGASPYGFQFSTYRVLDPICIGNDVFRAPKTEVKKSNFYHLGGTLATYDEVLAWDAEAQKSPDAQRFKILLDNMRGNGIWVVCVTQHKWRSTQSFEEDDVLVDMSGNVVEMGNSPRLVVYRAEAKSKYGY